MVQTGLPSTEVLYVNEAKAQDDGGSYVVECNSYGLTMWEVKTKYTVGRLGPIGSGG